MINILDPLTKPALTKRHLIGVYDQKLSKLIAQVLKELGISRAMVVSGDNGLDEVNICGRSSIVEIEGENFKEYEITPEDVGLKRRPIESIRGGNPKLNKKITLDILKGEEGGPRDVTLLNAAAALIVSGLVEDFQTGLAMATESIDKGAALGKLKAMVEISKKLK